MSPPAFVQFAVCFFTNSTVQQETRIAHAADPLQDDDLLVKIFVIVHLNSHPMTADIRSGVLPALHYRRLSLCIPQSIQRNKRQGQVVRFASIWINCRSIPQNAIFIPHMFIRHSCKDQQPRTASTISVKT
jgi:hypothetical protein